MGSGHGKASRSILPEVRVGMVGSDWPVSRRDGEPYEAWFDFVATSFGLTEAEQALVLRTNAATTYGIELG